MLWMERCIVAITDMSDLVREPLEAPVLACIIAPLVGRFIFPMIWLNVELFG